MTQKQFDIIHDALTYVLSRFEISPHEYDDAMLALMKDNPKIKLE